jgi:hypothetical protein
MWLHGVRRPQQCPDLHKHEIFKPYASKCNFSVSILLLLCFLPRKEQAQFTTTARARIFQSVKWLTMSSMPEVQFPKWVAPRSYQDRSHHWRDKLSIWYQYKKHKYSHSVYTGLCGKMCISCIGTIWRICLSSYDFCLDNCLVQVLTRVEFWIFSCFVLTLADGSCCAWIVYPIRCWYRCPEMRISSVYWTQLSRFYLKKETESSLRKVAFWNINRTF